MVDQDGEVLVPGLGGDSGEGNAAEGGGGGVSGAQGVGRAPGAVEPRLFGAAAEHLGNGVPGERLVADPGAVEAGEQRPGSVAAQQPAPGGEGSDGVGGWVLARSDGDGLPVVVLVGLGVPDGDEEAGGFVAKVEQGEAMSSARRMAEAYPTRMIVASRVPRGLVRSMMVTICPISAVVSGWACRRGAVP